MDDASRAARLAPDLALWAAIVAWAGCWISASPAVGPEAFQRRSLQIFVRLTAMVRNTPEASTRLSRAL